MTDIFSEIFIPEQKFYSCLPFPAVLSPALPCSIDLLVCNIETQRAYLESLLRERGALLLRGFDVNTAEEFNEVVEAFGYEELRYIGGAAPRTQVTGRVYTANESPPDQKISFHHELAHTLEYPSKLFFYCDEEPASGGETPIVLSHIVCEKVEQKYPDFARRLEQQGLMYIRVAGDDDDPSSSIGRGWKSTFHTDDKIIAEKRAAEKGIRLEWIEDGVKLIIGPMSALRFDQSRNCKTWFNSMVGAYTCWIDSRNDPGKAVTFGNGEPISSEVIHGCLKIHEEECVAIPWKKGDILLLDNLAVLHARRSFTSPRRILASLCK